MGHFSCWVFDFHLYNWSFSILKQFTMFIAVPASGKTTFVNAILHNSEDHVFVFSTDDYIEVKAKNMGKTYNDIFADTIGEAEKEMFSRLSTAVKEKIDIIADRTNLSRKARARILNYIPKDYKKLAVFIQPPASEHDLIEWNRRLASRPGKNIPQHVLENMLKTVQPPELSEGFDEIVTYDIWGNHVV